MKIMHFNLTSQVPQLSPGTNPPQIQRFTARSLSAYAVSHAFVQINGVITLIDRTNGRIINDDIELNGFNLYGQDNLILQIYYHGVRDYASLFPSVMGTEAQRAERMGQFYAEAEICFDGGAWMSFMLMSAAIFEHLLFFKLGSPTNINTLAALNRTALQRGAISQHAHDVINTTNGARNVIHCNRMQEPYITRAQALDAKTVIDELMRAF